MEVVLGLLVALGLAAVHLFVGRLTFLRVVPRSRWLSAAGGAAVAYIFLHLMPEIAAAHDKPSVGWERLYWAVAFLGLVVFYGLERLVRRPDPPTSTEAAKRTPHGAGAFWLHIGSFTLYNLIIGYLLLHREEYGLWPLLLYGIAMGLHFLSSDFGMRLDHQRDYDRTARWVLAAGILGGWLLGWLAELPWVWVDVLFAFLAGGVVLNIMKEELPEERKSRFGAFLFGAVAYGALLLATSHNPVASAQ